MRKFLKNVGNALQIGEQNSENEVIGQGAIVTFSDDATVEINLKQSDTKGSFADKVETMPGPSTTGGRTRTDKGLALADKDVVIESAGYRKQDPEVAKILVVITDGEQTKARGYTKVSDAVKPFHERGMTVFAIGVGTAVKDHIPEIRSMVKEDENAIFPDSYADLTKDVDKFVRRFCPGIIKFV